MNKQSLSTMNKRGVIEVIGAGLILFLVVAGGIIIILDEQSNNLNNEITQQSKLYAGEKGTNHFCAVFLNNGSMYIIKKEMIK